MTAKKILIIGTGAQSKYALETFQLLGRDVLGILTLPGEDCRVPALMERIIGSLDELDKVYRDGDQPETLLATSSNHKKEEVTGELQSYHPSYASAIHPAAIIASSATLGHGLIVNANAVVQPFATVGSHCMIHAGTIIEHDCTVADFVNIAPRATLAGYVKIGQGTTVCAGAVVIPTIKIGRHAVIGAGAVVTSDVADYQKVAGVPARIIGITRDMQT